MNSIFFQCKWTDEKVNRVVPGVKTLFFFFFFWRLLNRVFIIIYASEDVRVTTNTHAHTHTHGGKHKPLHTGSSCHLRTQHSNWSAAFGMKPEGSWESKLLFFKHPFYFYFSYFWTFNGNKNVVCVWNLGLLDNYFTIIKVLTVILTKKWIFVPSIKQGVERTDFSHDTYF